jgi:hypothetical protein
MENITIMVQEGEIAEVAIWKDMVEGEYLEVVEEDIEAMAI